MRRDSKRNPRRASDGTSGGFNRSPPAARKLARGRHRTADRVRIGGSPKVSSARIRGIKPCGFRWRRAEFREGLKRRQEHRTRGTSKVSSSCGSGSEQRAAGTSQLGGPLRRRPSGGSP